MKNLVLILVLSLFFSNKALAISIADRLLEQSKVEATKASPNLDRRMRALKQSDQPNGHLSKSLLIKATELKDSAGLVYVGGRVSAADLVPYLEQLKAELGDEFAGYRQNQAARDHQSFHLTLVNPYEYQTLDKGKIKLDKVLRVNLIGLGKASKEGKTAYFVVAESSDGQFYRQNLLLKAKDFHVTLGFKPQDVFGVSKGRDSLIATQKLD